MKNTEVTPEEKVELTKGQKRFIDFMKLKQKEYFIKEFEAAKELALAPAFHTSDCVKEDCW